ncbi:hypothetical protein [Cupriavidus necator]|uniref:hypothetical protein n=1 Tax=Cupriavidus necator TaxID=106590 RepID=UPI003F7318E7
MARASGLPLQTFKLEDMLAAAHLGVIVLSVLIDTVSEGNRSVSTSCAKSFSLKSRCVQIVDFKADFARLRISLQRKLDHPNRGLQAFAIGRPLVVVVYSHKRNRFSIRLRPA